MIKQNILKAFLINGLVIAAILLFIFSSTGLADQVYIQYITQTSSASMGANATAQVKFMQLFTTDSTLDDNVLEISFIMAKSGSPSDNLVVGIYALNGSTNPTGSALSEVQKNGSTITGTLTWYSISAPAYMLEKNTKYGIVFSRSGSIDASNYYTVGYSTTSYPAGPCWKYNTSWLSTGIYCDFKIKVDQYTPTEIPNYTQTADAFLTQTAAAYATGTTIANITGTAAAYATGTTVANITGTAAFYATETATWYVTNTPTPTETATDTLTTTPTATATDTLTPTPTSTNTPTNTLTNTPTATDTFTPTLTLTPTETETLPPGVARFSGDAEATKNNAIESLKGILPLSFIPLGIMLGLGILYFLRDTFERLIP